MTQIIFKNDAELTFFVRPDSLFSKTLYRGLCLSLEPWSVTILGDSSFIFGEILFGISTKIRFMDNYAILFEYVSQILKLINLRAT